MLASCFEGHFQILYNEKNQNVTFTIKSRAVDQSTEMRFASFLSGGQPAGGFTTAIELTKRTSVQSTI